MRQAAIATALADLSSIRISPDIERRGLLVSPAPVVFSARVYFTR
jgi:hypothetical protein